MRPDSGNNKYIYFGREKERVEILSSEQQARREERQVILVPQSGHVETSTEL